MLNKTALVTTTFAQQTNYKVKQKIILMKQPKHKIVMCQGKQTKRRKTSQTNPQRTIGYGVLPLYHEKQHENHGLQHKLETKCIALLLN